MRKILIVLFLFLSPEYGFSKTIHRERQYQEFWCDRAGGRMEVVLSDRTRVDCLTGEYAVEVDFARKWAEATGQSLFYSAMTGKRAGIVLILESPGERRFLKRLRFEIKEFDLPISVWVVEPGDLR